MAKDRSLDRHLNPGYLYRPVPSDLLKRLDDCVGEGRRAIVISWLIAAFLDGRPMLTVREKLEELDNSGQGRGA